MNLPAHYYWLIVGSVAISIVSSVAPSSRAQADIPPSIANIVQDRCLRCHSGAKAKGDVRLDRLSGDFHANRVAETWHDALNALNRGEMPPKNSPMQSDERRKLVEWIQRELDALAKSKSTATQSVIRRLNKVEYQNTMRDLLGIDHQFSANLPPDERGPDGFTNHADSLRISDLQMEYYLQAARRAFKYAIVEGGKPNVHRHEAVESVADKGKGNWTNFLGRSGVFVARIPEFPDDGEFVIRVRAHAEDPAHPAEPQNPPINESLEKPPSSAHPRMRIRFGYRADTQTPSRVLAETDVITREPTWFEFRGRMEEFPVQSRTQSKYPGMLIWIDNTYDDGKPAPRPQTLTTNIKGKRKRTVVYPKDPMFPSIVIDALEFTGPVFQQWPPEHHIALVPSRSGDDIRDATKALRQFLPRAFRGDVDEPTVQRFVALFRALRERCPTFEEALRETFAAVLISPQFLYIVEPLRVATSSVAGPAEQLSEFEIASRLSYFLWSSMPDEALLELARAGKLSTPDVRAGQALRMLADPRSESFVNEFSRQWLDLDGVDRVAINPEFYPNFSLNLKSQMRQETQHFFGEILRNNLSVVNFLQSDFAMLNHDLALHYGLANAESAPRGTAFQRVTLDPKLRRGGLLTQGSILLANSTGEDSHPIKRGVWIRDRLLNDPPAPPPPNVPNLDSSNPDFASLPLKQQLAIHLENDACAQCHAGIDPWGVPLEEFDAVGVRRDQIQRPNMKATVDNAGKPKKKRGKGKQAAKLPSKAEQGVMHSNVDCTATLPDGTSVNGASELQKHLSTEMRDAFTKALIERTMSYAMGRSLGPADEPAIRQVHAELSRRKLGLRDLIESVVRHPTFIQ